MAKIETLVDDFATKIDSVVWDAYNGAVWEAGRAKCVTTTSYQGLISKGGYDLQGSSIYLKWQPPALGAVGAREFTFGVRDAANQNSMKFIYGGTPGSPFMQLAFMIDGTFGADYLDGYDPVAFPWLRLAIDQFQQSTWDISADGVNWTNVLMQYGYYQFGSVLVDLSSGQWAAEVDTQPGYFDNINTLGAAAGGRPKVWNGSAWVEKPVKVWNGSAWVVKPMKVWNGSAWVLA